MKTKQIRTQDVPEEVDLNSIYRLTPKEDPNDDYWLMLDRLNPFVSKSEISNFFQKWTITILGLGGMGGWIFLALVRLGILNFRIADPDAVDISNKGRQAVANNKTLGKNKAIEIARMARDIYSGNNIDVYPMGASKDSISELIGGATISFNEIEFWMLGSRMLAEQEARKAGVISITCPTVGHSTYIFIADENSIPLDEFLGISLDEAMDLELRIQQGVASQEEKDRVMQLMFKAYVPLGFPEHSKNPDLYSISDAATKRMKTGTAPIFGPNAMLSAMDVAQRVIIYLLNRESSLKRKLVFPESFPAGEHFNYLTRETTKISRNR